MDIACSVPIIAALNEQSRRISVANEPPIRGKKSVALSGVAAGNTALSTVGHTGNDLHYRGYDILDLARACTFEEVAHLLVHERLPAARELEAYTAKLKHLRGLPPALKNRAGNPTRFRPSGWT